MFSNKQLKTTDKNCSPVNTSTSYHYNKTDGQHSCKHKMKRLKSSKERSQVRGSGERASKSKSHHHCQSSKDEAHLHYCCQSNSHCPPRRDAQFAKIVAAAQEPSIITDSRLIGHHGLFNHEVKSIDIERLLSEQRKVEKFGQHGVQEKNMAASRPFLTSYLPSPCCSSDVVVADMNEGALTEKKADPATKALKVCPEREKTTFQSNSQRSDITPGQRPQHQLDLSFESDNGTFSSTNSPPDVSTASKDKENARPLNKKVKSQLNPQTLEHTPKNQEPPHHQIQSCGFSPNPLQFSSSPIAGTSDSFDTQHRGGGLDHISNSVSAVAANLCHCLQLPLLRRRDLVAESREVLVQTLRERHGPLLQENLVKVQRRLSFGTGPIRAVQLQDKGPSMIGTDGFWPTDVFNTAFQGGNGDQSHFDAQRTGSFKRRRKQKHSSGMSPRLSLDQTAEWMTGPSVEKVSDLLYEILRPCSSSRFCKDFQLSSRASSPNQLFTPSPTSRWGVKASPPQHWDDGFNRATRRESAGLDCYENGFLNQTRAVRERSSGPGYSESSRQPFLHYPAGLPEGHPAEPRHFPQEQDPFEIDSHSFVPSSYAQVRYPQERNQLHPFYHFNQPATRPSLLSHHTDMMHYPPSHMLERGPSPPRPSFPSPEHWSFPPMRLY